MPREKVFSIFLLQEQFDSDKTSFETVSSSTGTTRLYETHRELVGLISIMEAYYLTSPGPESSRMENVNMAIDLSEEISLVMTNFHS